ncbi:ANTAR domain-containing protein [Streptomyces azureus]|uniref:Translation initiation factor IF-2 n=1 Tax=Streptomyces azureus TaxID=146537 RepID=A0A0K8PI53_STRAJ|nr:ANTAR domain-containing protein [Streptomyces azureus]GAP47383.1 translation initiation factor IF-2 [Streptomyces azureus]
MRPPPHSGFRRARSAPALWAGCDEPPGAGGVPDRAAPERVERLEPENEQLKQAIDNRPMIDMARGALMAGFGCTSDEAWEILVQVSQNSTVKLRALADAVTAAVNRTRTDAA